MAGVDRLLRAEGAARAALERAMRSPLFRRGRTHGSARSRRTAESMREVAEAVRRGRQLARGSALAGVERLLGPAARRAGLTLPPIVSPGSAVDAARAAKAARALANLWDTSYARAIARGRTRVQAEREAMRRVVARARCTAATESAHAFNLARQDALKRAAARQPGLRRLFEKQWTVNSSNPCPACLDMHEVRVPIDRDFAESCPLHPTCRCVVEIVEKE